MKIENIRKNKILYLGFGYTARYLNMLLNNDEWSYEIMSTRFKQVIDENLLSEITHILVSAPPNGNQDPSLILYRELLVKIAPHLKWVGYLSATSVYGDYKGEVVTENSECHPKTERGKNRLNIENQWQELAKELDLPLHIFRLSGIYGDNRNTISEVISGEAVNIIKQNHLTNRIYIKDIGHILLHSMFNPHSCGIFNLSDDMPASTAALNDYIAFLLDRPLLKRVAYDDYRHKLSAMRQSFYQESKIVSNEKVKKIYALALQYPTYREGLMDIIYHKFIIRDTILN